MTYSAIEIAKYIVGYCNHKGKPISNLKLQKILYYVWVNYYRDHAKPLFDEEFCAWQFGPVIPEVYFQFSSFAGIPIRRNYETNVNSADSKIIDRIIDKYAKYSAAQLVDKTHKKGGPWDVVYHGGTGLRKVIPSQQILKLESE